MLHLLALAAAFVVVGRAQPAVHKSTETAPSPGIAEQKAPTLPGGASKGIDACRADIKRYCKGIKPGEGRLGACLKKNAKKLSNRCKRWASHGGATHMDEAFTNDIDGAAPAPDAPPKK